MRMLLFNKCKLPVVVIWPPTQLMRDVTVLAQTRTSMRTDADWAASQARDRDRL